MKSLWQATADAPCFPALDGDRTTDVLIIGGGAAGLLTAHMLTKAGVDCLVAEGQKICGGVTAHTTAKLTAQHGLCYDAMINNRGFEYAKGYYDANTQAIEDYKALSEKYDFDLKEESNYVYSTDDFPLLQREYEALKTLGAEAQLHRETPLPLSAAGMVELKNQFSIHPLKLFYSIAEKLNIFENSFVRSLEGTTAVTDRGRIRANWVVVATHFPFINRHGMYFMKLYQQRSYVVALENAPKLEGMYVDNAVDGFSFRPWGDWLLVGGGGHKTGVRAGGPNVPAEFAKRHFPQARPRFFWAAQDCRSLDGVPYIGRYSALTPKMFVATGFNTWGMSSSMAAARLITELITTGKGTYEHVFSPQRSMLCNQLLKNGAAYAEDLLTLSTPRCTHMGCALKKNTAESSWDCPCHGSRYDMQGNVLENPAMKNLKSKRL